MSKPKLLYVAPSKSIMNQVFDILQHECRLCTTFRLLLGETEDKTPCISVDGLNSAQLFIELAGMARGAYRALEYSQERDKDFPACRR